MDDQNQPQGEVVTLEEAIEKVKSWIKEKDFEKAKQGAEEILTVNADNEEVKGLLKQAEDGLSGGNAPAAPAVTPKPAATPPTPPATPPTPATPTTPATPPPLAPLGQEKPAEEKPAATPPPMPESNDSGIFNAFPGEKEEPKIEENPMEKTEETAMEEPQMAATNTKHFPTNLVLILIFVIILVGLGVSYYMGWLNPVFESILGLLGM